MRKTSICCLDDFSVASPEVQEAVIILTACRCLPQEDADRIRKYYDAYAKPWERYPDHCW